MSELNSSLCQLNWLIAKGGIGNETVVKQEPIVEDAPKPTEPLREEVAQPKPAEKKTRRSFEGPDKPPYSYSQLIRLAIENTEEKKSTLADIYAYIRHNFQFYRENRNSSWKNSIRHNLSLNKQFCRVEKADGDRRGWWVCVDPPEKKPRILKGSPVRVNPIYEQMYLSGALKQPEPPAPLENTYVSDMNGEVRELTEQEINDLNLFESYDLNSSFRDVYDQIFEKPSPNVQQKAAQIDWLKISLEAAGLDYQDEQEMRVVDTAKLKDYVQNGFPVECESEVSTPRTDNSRHSSSESNYSAAPVPNEDSDDDFDWNQLL